MKILALDTSTPFGSVALAKDGRLLAECNCEIKKGHSTFLLPSIDHLLSLTGWTIEEIDLVACAVGPGSFAGLRVGISTAKGIAFPTGAKLVGVNTLDGMAWPYRWGNLPVCPVLDAKKKQVYSAFYQPMGQKGQERKSEDLALKPAELCEMINEPTLLIGEGAMRYREIFESQIGDRALFVPDQVCYNSAGSIAALGWVMHLTGEVTDRLVPNYVRPPDAVVKGCLK